MRAFRFSIAIPALLLLTACASPVRYDYDVSQDFSRYKTFDLYAPGKRGKNKGGDDPLMDSRIRVAVAAELQGKGFTREEVADPDFLVACYPVFHTRHYRTTTRVGFGGGGWSAPGATAWAPASARPTPTAKAPSS